MIPLGTPVPPSPETSSALVAAFAERDIAFIPRTSRRLARRRARRGRCSTTVSELPCDLFLGVPKHRAPEVVIDERHDRGRLHPGRLGHARRRASRASTPSATSRTVGRPEGRRVRRGRGDASSAQTLIAQAARRRASERRIRRAAAPCYIEFGARAGRARGRRLPLGPRADAAPSRRRARRSSAEKQRFGSSRRARWFGL